MRWEKLGRLYCPRPVHPKLATHAANPLAVALDGDLYRVFFSGRDDQNRSSVGFVDVNIVSRQVMYVHDRPAFEHGPPGSFYSHAVSVGNPHQACSTPDNLFLGSPKPPDS